MGDAKQLYIKTESGIEPIDPAITERYKLKAGTLSPFSRSLIIDLSETPEETVPDEDRPIEVVKGELVNDGIAQLDNGLTLSHSEMIDIAEGVDSKNS